MIFSLLKLIIWVAGVTVITYFAMSYFGYGVNWNYFDERKAVCQEKLEQCKKDLINTGIEGAKKNCDFQCVNPELLIKKRVQTETK